MPVYYGRALALEPRALSSGPVSDTKTPMTLEKSLAFSEFGDHSQLPSGLNTPWSCTEGTISKHNSGTRRPELLNQQQIHQTQRLLNPRLFSNRGAPKMSAFSLGHRPVKGAATLEKVLGHSFVITKVGSLEKNCQVSARCRVFPR